MSKLNEKNEKTEKVIHLLVTPLCNRNCKHCCNKQYDLNDIPTVTDTELRNCHTLCLTGGEPFTYTKPNEIARYYKKHYPNIKKVYVYTNAKEFTDCVCELEALDLVTFNCDYIDGVNISIKTTEDVKAFEKIAAFISLFSELQNRLYVFNKLMPSVAIPENFTVIERTWQKDFVPADDSIFRKM